jgi:hypothetical protein
MTDEQDTRTARGERQDTKKERAARRDVVFPYAILNWNLTRPMAVGLLRADEVAELEIRDEQVVQLSGNRLETWGMGRAVLP